MISKIRNIIIFVTIGTIFVLIYIYFIKPPANENSLVSSAPSTALPGINDSATSASGTNNNTSLVAKDFLALLLNVKNIKLNDAILADPAFASLHDSSITLTPDGNEGRVNPFAPFGTDATTPISSGTKTQSTSGGSPGAPANP